jgi:hypothetical protein
MNPALNPSIRRLRSSGGGTGGARKPDEEVSSSVSVASFTQISSFLEAMGWLQTSFVPTLWHDSGRVATYYRTLGGMHLRFEETKLTQCTKSKYLADFYNKDCRSTGNDRSGTEMWLDIKNPAIDEAIRSANTMCGPRMLSSATTGMKAQTLLYNGELAFLSLVTASFSQELVGSFKPKIKFCELGEMYSSWTKHIGDIVWGLLLMYFFVGEFMRIGRERVKQRPWRQILNSWTLINITIFVWSLGISIFWTYFSVALQSVGEEIHSHNNDLAKIRRVYTRVEDLCLEQAWNETCLFWYSLLLMVKFFQAFLVNARLAVISTTIKESARELAHFILVFGLIFFNYALGAHILFGKHIQDWSTFRRSVNMCFLVLMGDFDYASMHAIAPISSQLWFWSFMMLVFMIMLNMLLVIVMDVYCQVKERASSTETLYAQAVFLIESISQDLFPAASSPTGTSDNSSRYDFFWLEKVASALEHPKGVIVEFAEESDPFAEADEQDTPELMNMDMLIEVGCPAHRAAGLLLKSGAQQVPPKDEDQKVPQDDDDNGEVEEPEPEDLPEESQEDVGAKDIKVDPDELRARITSMSKQIHEMRTNCKTTWAQVQAHLELLVLQNEIGRVPEVWSTTSLGICTSYTKKKGKG